MQQDSIPYRRRVTRRRLIRIGAGVGSTAMIGAWLAACGSDDKPTSSGATTPGAATQVPDAGSLVMLSTQFTPVEEAEKMRKTILEGFKGKVEYLPEQTGPFNDRIRAETRAGRSSVSLIGGLHGDFAPFAKEGLLEDVSALLGKLSDRGFPQQFVELGKLGTSTQYYVPWMQATYIMAANKKALQYLPQGANQDRLTYAQLREWGANIQRGTNQRRLGFPAGPMGLIHRFFQGYLYPSYTRSSGVVEFRSPEAVQMWTEFKETYALANPQSTNYDFMQEPLLSEEVWVAWDHVARLINAVKERPNDFVMFPAPAGPKGRGFMPVIAGFGIPKGAANRPGAELLVQYLTEPKQQIATLRELAFFPVTNAAVPDDLPPGIKLEAEAVKKQSSATDAIPSLLPVGLGVKGGEFNKVYLDTFDRIVRKNEPAQQVLTDQARVLQGIITETGAACWPPDPASTGPCAVKG